MAVYFDALGQAQAMDRQAVRAAAGQFATDRIVDSVLESLAERRCFAP